VLHNMLSDLAVPHPVKNCCGGAMHDALMIGEDPAIPTRFQAQSCCDTNCGKKQQVSRTCRRCSLTSAPGSWGSHSPSMINRGETARLQPPPTKTVPNTWNSDHTSNLGPLFFQLAVRMSPSEAAIIVARFLKANSYDEV
jgi:hypothetical protein